MQRLENTIQYEPARLLCNHQRTHNKYNDNSKTCHSTHDRATDCFLHPLIGHCIQLQDDLYQIVQCRCTLVQDLIGCLFIIPGFDILYDCQTDGRPVVQRIGILLIQLIRENICFLKNTHLFINNSQQFVHLLLVAVIGRRILVQCHLTDISGSGIDIDPAVLHRQIRSAYFIDKVHHVGKQHTDNDHRQHAGCDHHRDDSAVAIINPVLQL